MFRLKRIFKKLFSSMIVISSIVLSIYCLLKLWEHLQEGYYFRRITEKFLLEEDYGADDRDPEVSCHFPLPSPLATDVMEHFRKASPLRCRWFKKSYWAEMDRGTLKLNSSAHQHSEFSPCQYSEISRPEHDHDVIYGPIRELVDPVVPQSDFVYVECNNIFGYPIYQDFLAYAKRNLTVRKFKLEGELSVAAIGIDSMSRMNFIRQMPASYDYLKNELGAVNMLGFNKVGRNTFPNVIPMLTGDRPPSSFSDNFESFRFVWDEFSDAGAATTYAEDWPTSNMFEIWGDGLKKKPTHHYLHTFYRAFQNTLMEKLSMPQCLGGRPLHQHHFSYLLSVLRVYADSPSFMFSLHNGLSHDGFNSPQNLDADFKNFLKSAQEEGLLNRTVLIVFGDHGQRVDAVRMSAGGRIEDMMPLVSVVLPANARPEWASALRRNRNRLLSSHDFYPTFLDVLSTLTTANKSMIEDKKRSVLGRSFFSDIPKNRTCEDANIEDWFCSCVEEANTFTPMDTIECGQTVTSWINEINRKLIDTKQCARLSLSKSNYCMRSQLNNNTWTYRLSFETLPGGAYLEATARWYINETSSHLMSLGRVARYNKYSHQSYCIKAQDNILRELCYCLR